jgi:hypothetical protein
MMVGGVVKFLLSSSSSSRSRDSLLVFSVAWYWVVFGGFDEWRWCGFDGVSD